MNMQKWASALIGVTVRGATWWGSESPYHFVCDVLDLISSLIDIIP